MLSILILLLCATLWSVSTPLRVPCDEGHIVHLPTGLYNGSHDSNTSTTTYYNIPYAFADRFAVPRPIEDMPVPTQTGLIDASNHGPACVNFNLPPPYDKGFEILIGGQVIEPQSEDCLNLDVYVPDGKHVNLPVLVYTPGGGFLVGGSFTYDMKPLVAHGLEIGQPFIGVVLNYRLGPLGFLNPSTWGEHVNLGLLDQVEALRWIRRNIARFGGSPEKVTISGESSGGESTMHQLLWTNEDLFRSAWMMSVPSSGKPYLTTEPESNDKLVESYAKACGCSVGSNIVAIVECLRKTKVSVMVNQSAAWGGSQTSLGGLVKRNVFEEVRSGKWPKVPLVLSATRDEGSVIAFGFSPNDIAATKQSIGQLISGRGLVGKTASKFLKAMLDAYPNDPVVGCPFDGRDTDYGQGSQYKRVAAISTDATFVEPWSEYLQSFSGSTRTWGLLWEQPLPGIPAAFGVVHGSDLNYYFPTLFGTTRDPRKIGQANLVHALFTAVVRFVNHGDPNGVGEPANHEEYQWPEFASTRAVTVMDASNVAEAQLPPHRPGFDVLHRFLRPGPLIDAGEL